LFSYGMLIVAVRFWDTV